MKKFLVPVVLSLILSGCGLSTKSPIDAPAYNPYVEAFTSGRVPRKASVSIMFSEVPEPKLRTSEALSRAASLRPSVSGRWEWQDEKTAVFRPAEEFRRDTRYTVTVAVGSLFGAEGKDRKFAFSFETLPLALRAATPRLSTPGDSDDDTCDVSIDITSADSESPETVERMVTLSEAATVQWTHTEGGTSHTLVVQNIAMGNAARNLVVSSTDSALATVHIPAKTDFGVYDATWVSYPEKYIEVTFTKALDSTQNLQGLAFIQDGDESGIVTVEGNRLRLYPASDAKLKLTVFLSAHIRSVRGLTLGEDTTREVTVSGEVPAFRFVGNGVIIPRSEELSIPFEAVWLRGVTVSVTRIYEKNAGQFLQVNNLDGGDELARVGRLVARKTVWLDETGGDLSKWKTYAVDLRKVIEPEPGAIYRIEFDMRQDLSAYPCDGAAPQKSKEQIAAEDEAAFRSRLADYDGGYYYYYDSYYGSIDWDRYEYSERNDPCTYSFYADKRISRNVLATDLGLIVKAGRAGEISAVVHNLITAVPMGGVTVDVYNFQGQVMASGVTDAEGVATMTIGSARPWYARASHDTQRTYLRIDSGAELSTSSFDVSGEAVMRGIKGFIYGDRGVWRPGDTMYLSFMLGDRVGSLPPNVPVVCELYDPLGQLYARKTQTHGEMGLYAFDMPTEPDARTGAWRVQISVGGATFTRRVRVETIKPNRLKINFGFGNRSTVRAGSRAEGDLHVEWLTGAKARSLKYEIDASVRSVATRFDGFDGFVFDDPSKSFNSREVRIASGNVDAEGNARVGLNLEVGESAPGMLAAMFTTRVYEESGDFSIDGLSIGYSPFERYVGVRSPQTDHNQLSTGSNHRFSVALVNYEGRQLVNQTVRVEVYKVEWHWWWDSGGGNLANYMSRAYNRPVETIDVVTDTNGRASFTLNKSDDEWGTYYIRVSDVAGRHTAGVKAYFDWPDSWRRGEEEGDAATELVFTTDKETYAPGEMMAITLPSSTGARAIVSIENGTRVLRLSSHECLGTQTVVQIPVTEDMGPNVYVNVTLLQPHGATANDVPIRLYGIVPVTVTSPGSHLSPVLTSPGEIRPESRWEMSVSEKDGRPMAYTLAIVDEGLLDLTRFATPDPWAAFNAKEALGVSTFDMYNYVLGAYGGRIESLFSIGGDDEADGGDVGSVNRFKPVVRFEGPFSLKKGEKRRHSFTMDNYNGRVRVMVVAGDGAAYGSVSQSVMVRKPVMLLGTLPRVIGSGEEMDVPVTVFATEDGVGDVQVSIATTEGMTIVGEGRKTINFSRTGDRTVTFRVRTSAATGAGRVTLTAMGKGDQSVWETDIEIRSVRREQSIVTAATVAPGSEWGQNIALPGAGGTNSVTLEVSSIPPINLSTRLRYLLDYPHGCLEQITSKAFPQLYVGGFSELSGKQKLDSEAAVAETIRRYRSYQTAEGALAYWPGGTSTDAYTSVYAAHFLTEAAARGHLVPEGLKRSLFSNLSSVARGWKRPASDSYLARSEQFMQAYRLYVLALAARAETGAMNRLREETTLSAPARWMLAAAYAVSGRKDVAGGLIAATTPMSEGYNAEADITFGGPIRDRAIKLLVLTMMDRATEAAEMCREISSDLSSDSWISTQSTAWAMMAVSRYTEKWTTDSRMRFSYDVAGAGAAAGIKRAKDNINSNKSIWTGEMVEKAAAGIVSALVENRGSGTLFVRVVTTGTPDQGNETAYANNVVLEARYTDSAGRPLDVSALEKGTALTSFVTVRNPTPRVMRNLVLTQIFPVGWEILSTRYLGDGASSPTSGTATGAPAASGISYQDIRDDRVHTYIDLLPAGQSVTVRLNLAAIYGGRFYLPPVWVEAMYDNLTRANTEGGEVTVN
ncbi:MAG: hypothetical protein LBR57_02210 [Alistipes sp.]|jgi:uncharacterized protein YfaS (alpha-2-macroglobulin family)|nr:hypothetical protein [Alistipes sp.]